MPGEVLFSAAQERADVYALLAALLLDPTAEVVAGVAALPRAPDADGELAWAWNGLLEAAGRGAAAVAAEYQSLFVAAGTPPLNPHEGCYRGGRLMGKALARLPDDQYGLGPGRAAEAMEREDHLGARCETMRLLLRSGRPRQVQRDFFARHLAGWSQRCLRDMASASATGFYAALATFMQAFLRQEAAAFGLNEEPPSAYPPKTARHVQAPS